MLSITSRETKKATAFPFRVIPLTPSLSVSLTAFGTEAANSVMVKSAFFTEEMLILITRLVNARTHTPGRSRVAAPAPTRFLNPNRPVRASHLEMTQLSKMINRRPWRLTVLAACLVVTGLSPNLTAAQDVKVNLGSGDDSEKAKQNKELADKLRPEQQAAYLNRVQAWSSVESIVGSAALVGLPLGIVAMVLTFRHRRQKLAHETMRLMIEKGLSVPPELINPPPPIKPPKNDLRRGAVWLAIGLALLVGMKQHMEDWWSFALIPTFMGVAYLVCWFVARNGERQNGRADGLWRGVFWALFGVALIIAMRAMQHANGDWDRIADWWSVGLIPTAIGAAFLLHSGILWLIERKKMAQG